MSATNPRCPYCNVQGVQHLAAQQLKLFTLIYCGQCGAIFGVVPAQQKTQPPQKKQAAKEPPPEQPPKSPEPMPVAAGPKISPRLLKQIGNADLSDKLPYSPARIRAAMANQAKLAPSSLYRMVVMDDGPPLCLRCKAEMEKLVIPNGYRNARRAVWVCPAGCEDWELAEE